MKLITEINAVALAKDLDVYKERMNELSRQVAKQAQDIQALQKVVQTLVKKLSGS